MITITEKSAKKCPGLTSLYLQSDYDKRIVSLIHTFDGCSFDKKTLIWEIPVCYLQRLLDGLCTIDDIDLTLQKDNAPTTTKKQLGRYKLKPFKHQIEGVQYGLEHDKWLLLDSPGLGKTLTLTILAAELKRKHNIHHCLIICGINTLKSNWVNEIKKYTDIPVTILGQKTTKTGKVVIGSVQDRLEHLKRKIPEFFVVTNVETLRNDKIINALNKGPNEFEMMVCDEIHALKSPTSQQGENFLKLTKAKFKVGATGTVIVNDPGDAYVPLKWIGAEKSSFSTFKYFYYKYGGDFNNVVVGFKNMDVLKDQLESVSLRRTNDLLDLPTKNIITELVEMEPKQELFYKNIVKGIVDQVDKVKMHTASILSMVTRLRQATACPSVLTTESIPSAKVDRACDLTEQILSQEGNKLVIMTVFKETAYNLEKLLKKYNPTVNTGDIKDSEIAKNIADFQSRADSRLFIGTIAKMGTGITLNKASFMILIDEPWTAAMTEQCEDRIWRIGSEKPVFIYHLITQNTIDQRVHEIVLKKGAISDYIVDDQVSNETINSLRQYIEDLEV